LYQLKKATAILFILCANIVLLTHAVVPHHHHDDIACFVLPVEEKHDHCCDHQDADHQEKHKPGASDDCCVLNDLIAIIPDANKQALITYDFSAHQKIVTHYLSILIPTGNELPIINTRSYFRQEPVPADCRPASGTLGVGLRAPPYC
jgi:hypothetical protein